MTIQESHPAQATGRVIGKLLGRPGAETILGRSGRAMARPDRITPI
jgi:hypothetical protein